MRVVDSKNEITILNAIPEKKIFWSIISDYDLKTGICELIDNAIDTWINDGRKGNLKIEIELEVERQLIVLKDNAGGVSFEDLRYLVTPGGSKNEPTNSSIGIFGVGSKRALVALAEVAIIKTRHNDNQTYQVDITNEWLSSPSWELAAYEIPNIDKSSTWIELSSLRKLINLEDIETLNAHIGSTYSKFVSKDFSLLINGNSINGIKFDNWAYPPEHSPQKAAFSILPDKKNKLCVTITAGLILDRIPEAGNYGVYFYCNNRLVVKELKSREVGYYITSEAGVPHTDASLCRVVVEYNGPANLMPWTSNKSNINTDHQSFLDIRITLIQLVAHFSKLSRSLRGSWDEQVFRYPSGKIISIDKKEVSNKGKLVLPPIPRTNKSHAESLKKINHKKIKTQPWTLGLVESMAALDIISRQKLETKNRIALILLDSNFEIALKEYVVHNTSLFPNINLQELFKKRENVIKLIAGKIRMESELLGKAQHYYNIRNKLIHERATIDVVDSDIQNYSETVKRFLKLLFDLKFD